MTDLPTLADRRVDELEDAIFTTIARERDETQRRDAADARLRMRRRRTWWGVSGAAAAVLVAAAALAPQLSGLGGIAGSGAVPAADQGWDAAESGVATTEGVPFSESGPESGRDADALADVSGGAAGSRDVIATASAAIVVDDTAAAAERIGASADAAGGYVESLSLGRTGSAPDTVNAPDGVADMATWPPAGGDAWISVRVPAAELQTVIDGLGDVGEVTSSRITRDDVTTQTVDLRARVTAGQVSVERLTALLSEAGSVSDLIAAESALAERQAQLESLQQQLQALESQVTLSSLTVELSTPAAPVDADPAGFGDGWEAGWNGLVATFNGIIVALGFLLPWLAVVGLVALLVWLAVSSARRRRAHHADATEVHAGSGAGSPTERDV